MIICVAFGFSVALFLTASVCVMLASFYAFMKMRQGKSVASRCVGSCAFLVCLIGCFNLVDCAQFLWLGALSLTPLNHGIFHVLFEPEDFFAPYGVAAIDPEKSEYVLPIKHRYAGPQEIVLCIPMGANVMNRLERQEECQSFELKFDGRVVDGDGHEDAFSTTCQASAYWQGENVCRLHGYFLGNRLAIFKTYFVHINISGNVSSFLSCYPGSYLAVRNATRK